MACLGPPLLAKSSRRLLRSDLSALKAAKAELGDDESPDESRWADICSLPTDEIRGFLRERKRRIRMFEKSETVLPALCADRLEAASALEPDAFVSALSENAAEITARAGWSAGQQVISHAWQICPPMGRRLRTGTIGWREAGIAIDLAFPRKRSSAGWARRSLLVLWRIRVEEAASVTESAGTRAARRVAAVAGVRRAGPPDATPTAARPNDSDACHSLHDRIRSRAHRAATLCRNGGGTCRFLRAAGWPMTKAAASRLATSTRPGDASAGRSNRSLVLVAAVYSEVVDSVLLVASRIARARGCRRIESADAAAAASLVVAPVPGATGFAGAAGDAATAADGGHGGGERGDASPVRWGGAHIGADEVVEAAFPRHRDEAEVGASAAGCVLTGPVLGFLPAGRFDVDSAASDVALLEELDGAPSCPAFVRSGRWRRLGRRGLRAYGTCVLLLRSAGLPATVTPSPEAAALVHGCLDWVVARLVRSVELAAMVREHYPGVGRSVRPLPSGSGDAVRWMDACKRVASPDRIDRGLRAALPTSLARPCLAAGVLTSARVAGAGRHPGARTDHTAGRAVPALSPLQVRRALRGRGLMAAPTSAARRGLPGTAAADPAAAELDVTRRCARSSGLHLLGLLGPSRRAVVRFAAVIEHIGTLLVAEAARDRPDVIRSSDVARAALRHRGLRDLLVHDGIEGGSPLHRLLGVQRDLAQARRAGSAGAEAEAAVEAALAAVPQVVCMAAVVPPPRPWTPWPDDGMPRRPVRPWGVPDDSFEDQL